MVSNMKPPWYFSKDMNNDGLFTISDCFEIFKQLFFLPGDTILYFFINKNHKISIFFELDSNDYRGFISFIISLFLWLIILFIWYGIRSAIDEWLEQKARQ